MLTGSVAANVISQGISGLLDAIGGRLAAAITSAEQTVVQLMNSNVKVWRVYLMDLKLNFIIEWVLVMNLPFTLKCLKHFS